MKKITTLLLSSFLLVGAVACSEAEKTSANAPAAPTQAAQTPDAETAQKNQADGTSDVRRAQANSDIRAREQRNNVAGNPENRADGDLASEVRSKLEVNIPAGSLTVDAEDGAVSVGGTVPTPEQLAKIEPLAKEIKGVKSVEVKATVAPATPKANDNSKQ
ncbi:BON domain-containing protein [Ancylothrix sp. C2]|uniref:BON domain-containing protein n=1 Tax=Ancylothrix sp. D3o TaxID=2953691 RepID=UPI0021BB82EB|nr:BON domain-containing protein [Ancylothrix sp. D3o]MCT7951357.1 BON domain-containing protein [Ancylothrix sp. D3o]